MLRPPPVCWPFLAIVAAASVCIRLLAATGILTLAREDNWLIIHGPQIPGGAIRINYLEAYCRANSTEADWVQHTVIKHRSELVSLSSDQKILKLRDTLADGVVLDHTITAGADEIDFRLTAHKP